MHHRARAGPAGWRACRSAGATQATAALRMASVTSGCATATILVRGVGAWVGVWVGVWGDCQRSVRAAGAVAGGKAVLHGRVTAGGESGRPVPPATLG